MHLTQNLSKNRIKLNLGTFPEMDISEWKRLKFGIIIHWGIYSVPGFDDRDSVSRRRIKNGSEWYAERLTRTFRETKADKLTKEFHEENYGDKSYRDLVRYFKARDFSASRWADFFEEIGAKYVILTTKHHDGFCLWDTKTTKFNSVTKTPHINIVEELSKELRARDIKVGFYYSLMEFGRNFSKKYLNEIVKPQLRELRRYRPDIYFFDEDWIATSEQWDLEQFLNKVHKEGAIVNDRLGKDKELEGDYNNFEDRFIPEKRLKTPWEHINTIGNSWGINYYQKRSDYKSATLLKELYDEVHIKGGNFCLNLGPDSDGNFDPHEEKIIRKFSKLRSDSKN